METTRAFIFIDSVKNKGAAAPFSFDRGLCQQHVNIFQFRFAYCRGTLPEHC